jgi:hypothetical protein
MLLILLIFNSCEDAFETTLEIDPPEVPNAMVLNSFIKESDTLAFLSVGKVQNLIELDASLAKVNDATVSIQNVNTGEIINAKTLDGGLPINYSFEIPEGWVNENSEYEINVEHPDYPSLSARQVLAEEPSVVSIEYNEDGGIDQDGDDVSEIILQIEDRPGKQYFEILLFEYYEQNGNYFLGSDINLSSTDPSTIEGYNYSSLLIDDETFQDETKLLNVKFNNYFQDDTRFYLLVRAVSEDYFRYSKTLKLEDDSEDNPFQTPVQVYSNVDGGFGIFALFSEKSFIFDK